MTRPIPDHGTRACYLRGCRRDECREAHKRYCKEYDLRRHRHGPRNHDATKAADHLRQYIAEGWTHPALAEATSVPEHTINDLIYRANPKTSADNIRCILAFQPPPGAPPANYWINPAGTIRRIQALAVIGHPIYAIAAAVNAGESTLRYIVGGGRQYVSRDLASRIAGLYDDWSHKPGPSPYTRGRAAANRWHDPQFWEDTGRIDDPGFDPDATTTKTLALGEDAHELVCEQGYSWEHVAMRLGESKDNAQQAHRRWHAAQEVADGEAA